MPTNCRNSSWSPSSLVYQEFDSDFGNRFDPTAFDEVDQPPPVHILYPRPTFKTFYLNRVGRSCCNWRISLVLISWHLLKFSRLDSFRIDVR